jgi:ferritin-like metal-binding protein YciE
LGDRAQIVGANRRQLMAKEPKKLDELFHDMLKDIYFAEKKILSALPKMAKAAQDRKLKAAFEKHHTETETHVSRLEQVFGAIDAKPQARPATPSWALSKKARRSRRSTRALRLWMPAF